MEDFSEKIKHLRLIHFSLLIVGVVLLISEEIDKESKAVQAYNQIVAIQEAQKKWAQFDLENYVQETLQLRDYYSNSGTQFGGNFYQNFILEIKYLGPNLESDKESSEPKSDTLISSTYSMPVWTRVQKDGSEINKDKIENLENFQKLWNEHLMHPHYGYALTPSRISYFRPMKDFKPNGPEIPSHTIIESKTHLLKNLDESILGCEKLKVPAERHSKDPPYPISILWNLTDDLKKNRWMSIVGGQRVYGWEIPYLELAIIRNCDVIHSLGYYNLKYQLEERSEVKLDLLTHLTPTDADWREGYSFEDTFPELQELTENIQSTSIADLEKHFKNLSETVGKQVEVLGVKLPLSTLNNWGPLVLLGMQLYFWLHLKHFSRVTKGNQYLSFSTPWIGLYQDVSSRFVFIMTGMVLPVWVTYLSSKGKLIPFDWHDTVPLWQQDSVVGAARLTIAAALAIAAAYYAGKVQIKADG